MLEVKFGERGWFKTCAGMIARNADFTLGIAASPRSRQIEKYLGALMAGQDVQSWRAYFFQLLHDLVGAAQRGKYSIHPIQKSDGSLEISFHCSIAKVQLKQ
jgi:hypothetical protein